ncbi:MAG: hypothetical protein ACYDEN_12390 [Acidimicrobiales bacterium]
MTDYHPFEDTEVDSRGGWPGALRVRAAAMSVERSDHRRTDAVLVSANRFAVADGADDLDGSGAQAIEVVRRFLDVRRPAGSLHGALRASNWNLWYRSGARDGSRGLATVTVALWSGYRFVISHVGDSRTYLARADAELAEAICDQTPAQACANLEIHATVRATESASAVVVSVGPAGPWR